MTHVLARIREKSTADLIPKGEGSDDELDYALQINLNDELNRRRSAALKIREEEN